MLMKNSDYVENYCDIADIIFYDKFNFTFDSVEELEPPFGDLWLECINTALEIMDVLGIEQDITA